MTSLITKTSKRLASTGAVLVVAMLITTGFMPLVARAETLTRQLEIEMTGTDVSALQTFLAQDKTLYPQGIVTGYFGFLTKAAVANFQTRNGISAVGRVGPATLPVLNLQMAAGGMGMADISTQAPTIISVGVNSSRNNATVVWNTNETTKGVVYYSTSPLSVYEYPHSVTISGNTAMTDTNFRTSQNLTLQNLETNTTYYYMVHTTDLSGNVSVTLPSTFRTTN